MIAPIAPSLVPTTSISETPSADRKTIIVIGNGMVGLRFCEKLIDFDRAKHYRIVTFCEEPRAAYDRVGLTTFFAHRDAERLMLARLDWYREQGIELHLGDRARTIDREARFVQSDKGVKVHYDGIVMATGSFPFVPPVPGVQLSGVFVYRTLEDVRRIIEYGAKVKSCAVVGGGLLGLEAAKAVYDLGLKTHVVEFSGRLMPRQIDDSGSRILVRKIEELGVEVHLNKGSKQILGEQHVEGIEFNDGGKLDVGMVIMAAGIRPRDDLAKQSGLEVGARGGITVDDHLRTSDPRIFAIGECALHAGMVYGLVAPGYDMAETVAANLTSDPHSLTGSPLPSSRRFLGNDLSTKLKLMGVDVASFGDYEAPADRATPLAFEDPFGGRYKKLIFSKDGKRLLGGVLVGDAAEYMILSMLVKSGQDLPCAPHELIVGSGGKSLGGVNDLPDAAQVCSCNNVSVGAIRTAMQDESCDSIATLKKCTRAGTGCGGCMPLVTDLYNAELKKAGKNIVNHLCAHFAYSRTELFAIVRAKEIKTFGELLTRYGNGNGCEICRPTAASIFASLWNEVIVTKDHEANQDTNDRFLANIQRGGLYSVVPRVAGGEITPQKLKAIADVGEEFQLYTKITGGQRIDLFGAKVQDLPDIWERLIDAGFESGHAYGKALRTVKSCVGTTWCRYGVQDSVGFAIRIENRYKGIRSPHKLKGAVSGCVRECAEAQGKDFGLVATEKGYNLYVCGNGGAKPRHADLLAADLDEDTAIKYIDRFLGYYIMTADRLTRTSVWLEKLEGGLEHLKSVVIDDKLGICGELEAMIENLVATYQCEWAAVVNDPEKRRRFQQFANSTEEESCIEIVPERGQARPEFWPAETVSLEQFQQRMAPQTVEQTDWVRVGFVDDFPHDGGSAVKYGHSQIAVFRFSTRGEWYASQNMCPHKKAFVLSRGLLGDAAGTPKVACPMHKKTFSLETGESLQGEDYQIRTFPVRIEGDEVYLQLPSIEVLDQELATEIGRSLATAPKPACGSCATGCASHNGGLLTLAGSAS